MNQTFATTDTQNNFQTEIEQSQVFKNLKLFNLCIGVLHLVEALIIIIIGKNYFNPVYRGYWEVLQNGEITYSQTEFFKVPLLALVIFYLLVSSAVHLIIIIPRVFKWYLSELALKVNYLRWFEYSLTSTIAICILSMLSGTVNLVGLLYLISLNILIVQSGYWIELVIQSNPKRAFLVFLINMTIGLVPWLAIILNLLNIQLMGFHLPSYVVTTLVVMFFIFMLFPVNLMLYYLKIWQWKDYYFVEAIYIFLSIIAKSALSWIVFFNVLS